MSDSCDPMDCSMPGSSVRGILQARILEWVALSFFRGSSWPRNQTWVSCIAGRWFTSWAMREAHVKTLSIFKSNREERNADHWVDKSRTRLSDFTFTFHFRALEKEMATHSSVLAWRIPGTGEPGRLLSVGLHRVGHDWSDLAAAAAASILWVKKPFQPFEFKEASLLFLPFGIRFYLIKLILLSLRSLWAVFTFLVCGDF